MENWVNYAPFFGVAGVIFAFFLFAYVKSFPSGNELMMDLEDRIGSLETGKDADFIVLDGDPFSIYTKIEETWIEGERVFDRTNPDDLLYAIGGFGASHDQNPYLCCQGSGRTEQ